MLFLVVNTIHLLFHHSLVIRYTESIGVIIEITVLRNYQYFWELFLLKFERLFYNNGQLLALVS